MKKIKVCGYAVDDGGSGSHAHRVYITSWDGRPVHTHPFSGVTSYENGHHHRYVGMTAPAPTGVPHVHGYYTVTSLDDGHTHVIQGTTGPSVPIPGGGHVHYFEGYTTVNGRMPHTHLYRGTTGGEVG